MTALDRLAREIRAEGGLLAGALTTSASAPALEGVDHELVVEAVREGSLLHHATPRIVSREDPDLALLAGDRLYALGLERLAAAGDLHAVGVLAETIAEVARAAATGRPGDIDAIWDSGARQIVPD